jgi:hypothetical protein
MPPQPATATAARNTPTTANLIPPRIALPSPAPNPP